MKKLAVILLLLISHIQIFAWQPDSVLVKSERMYFFHYTDTAIHIKEISFDERNRIEIRESLADRWDSSRYINKGLLYGYNEFRFRADCENDLSGNKIPLLYNDTDYSDYTFFAPGRYATVRWDKNSFREDREYRDKHFTVTNAWKQESVDSLNFALLYDLHSYFQERDYCKREGHTFNPEEEEYNVNGFALPMNNGKYLLAAGYRKDTIYTPQRHNYDPLEMLYSRQLMKDTDTLQIDGKYGLYTITGNEVIPAIYDSLKTEEILVRAFRNGRTYLINYMGETVRENLRFAYPVVYRYQVLDNDGRMYFTDKQGNESDSYTHSFMSVDDQLFPLSLDIVLLPPKKPKYSKKKYKQYTWVNFIYPYDYQKFESLKRLRGMFSTPTQEDLNRLGRRTTQFL